MVIYLFIFCEISRRGRSLHIGAESFGHGRCTLDIEVIWIVFCVNLECCVSMRGYNESNLLIALLCIAGIM